MVKVAIAGGTGAVGHALAETFAKHQIHEAVILSRKVSEHNFVQGICCRFGGYTKLAASQDAPAKGVLPTVVVNYSDVHHLAEILEEHKIHTVISTFGINATSLKISQMNLIRASAMSAATRRFIPTSYCIDYPRQ